MAKKPRALGNDPFRRGAAMRPAAGEAPQRDGAAEAAPREVEQAKSAAASQREAQRSRARAETAAAHRDEQQSGAEANAAAASQREAQRSRAQATTAAAHRDEQQSGAEANAAAASERDASAVEAAPAPAEGAEARPRPRRRPTRRAAATEREAAAALPATRRRTTPTAGAAPRRATRRRAPAREAIELAGDAGLQPEDLGASVGEPADTGLLPDLSPAPREPAVVAVPNVPPAPAHVAMEPQPGPQPPREHHRPRDAASAALVALRQLAGLPGGVPSFDVDELGFDRNFEEQVRPLLDWFYDRWFRVELHGGDRLPQSGPVILVANRAGAIPWDSLMLSLGCRRLGREVRPLVEDDVFHFPSLGVLINRLGAVRACPENAELLLSRGEAVAVFPEGASGFGKPFRERYRLQRFGRGGFTKLALRTGARIVPVAIVGSEEIHPLLARLPGGPLGVPFVPVTPTFPLLGPAGLLPLPAKWHIEIGEPVDLGGHGPEAAKDDPLVLRLTEHVRSTIQAMLDERLAQRRSIFGG